MTNIVRFERQAVQQYSCQECKHFRRGGGHGLPRYWWCGSPYATKMDRIRGRVSPMLAGFTLVPEKLEAVRDETLARCDRDGWFEPKRSWWRFW